MTDLVLDGARSRVRLHTFAEGMFARLAHDLELVCGGLEGKATMNEGAGTGTLDVPIGKIEVGGILKNGRLDPHGLSGSERADILDKMRREVFRLTGREPAAVHVEATLDPTAPGKARVRVVPPHGPAAVRSVGIRLEEAGGTRITGSFELPITALGAGTVKGPMNAFRVKNEVVVIFDVLFRPAQPA